MAAQPKTINTHCNDCSKTTNHNVLFYKREITVDDFFRKNSRFYKSYKDYMAVQCCGCNELSFLIRNLDMSNSGIYNGLDYFDENFPSNEYELDVSTLNEDEVEVLPKILRQLYEEVEGAFFEESAILAGVGLRMLVEAICLQQKIPGNNLQSQIPKLHAAGLISANEIPILDKLRKIGNISVHEIKGFSIDKLQYALDIINHVLRSIYILPKINKRLKI